MRIEPIKFCWLDLGDGKVCERLAGHEPPCSPDPTVDFPIESPLHQRVELTDPNWLREAIDSVDQTGFSSEGLRADELLARGPVPTFTCPHCERTSTNPQDIANRYCGHCHHFCDELSHDGR